MSKIPLLKHQYELLKDTEHKILGLVSGFGAGKTHAAVHKAIQLCILNKGFTGIVLEPTYPLLRDAFIPLFTEECEKYNITYKLNKSDMVVTLSNGSIILLRSMENWERLVGVNAAWIIADEFDIMKQEIAMNAFNKLLGRIRSGNVRQFVITTTPEGFKATYEIFVKNLDESKRLIHARTTDNHHLPADYIDSLREQYPPNLLDAYLNGMFVNLTSGTVYSFFDRDKHDTSIEAKQGEVLHIGQDFNVGGCISTIHVIRDGKAYRVDEIESKHTFDIPHNVAKEYPNHRIVCYPDSSGHAGSTNASKSDIQLLKDAGWIIEAPQKNGAIQDRVNAVNAMLSRDAYFINTSKCPHGTAALEQQAYDQNGTPEKFGGAGTIDDYNDSMGYFIVRKFGLTRSRVTTHSIQPY